LVRTAVVSSGLPRVGCSAEEPPVGIAPFGRESLSMFVWAVANSCPWQFAATCETPALGRHLEALRRARLRRAREHGCPWSDGTLRTCRLGRTPEVLRWAMDNDCEWNWRTCSAPFAAGIWMC